MGAPTVVVSHLPNNAQVTALKKILKQKLRLKLESIRDEVEGVGMPFSEHDQEAIIAIVDAEILQKLEGLPASFPKLHKAGGQTADVLKDLRDGGRLQRVLVEQAMSTSKALAQRLLLEAVEHLKPKVPGLVAPVPSLPADMST